MALDRKTGKVVWEHIAKEETPHEASHPENGTWASASAATDGQHVIASFESRGYYAYDMNGKLIWEKDLGRALLASAVTAGSEVLIAPNSCSTIEGTTARTYYRAVNPANGDLQRVEGVC